MAAESPGWHWDEQAALRAELAEQCETAAVIEAALHAEIARLEGENAELREALAIIQGGARPSSMPTKGSP